MAYATRGGSSDPSKRWRSETGPARCRRALARASNVARSRTRQIRPRDACDRGRDGPAARRALPWCACGVETRGSWRACGCSVGTCASTKSLLEAAARGPRSGTAREAETAKCTAPDASHAMRGDVWGKPLRPLVAQGRRCYVARFARRRPAGCASPACHSSIRPTAAPLLQRSPHLWTLLWTSFRCRRTRRSGHNQAGPLTGGREKNGDR
jgi:hypothetical protein